MNKDHMIRFIDTDDELDFFIPDGGYITITRHDSIPEGESCTRQCHYIDDDHFKIGSKEYHIIEFAVVMERIGAEYVYEPEPESVLGYILIERTNARDKVYVMGHNPNAEFPYVTWKGYKDKSKGYEWGHYFSNESEAFYDLNRRSLAERRGIPYEYIYHKNKRNIKAHERGR